MPERDKDCLWIEQGADVASEQMTVYKEKVGKPVLGSVVLMRLVNRVTNGGLLIPDLQYFDSWI